MRHKSFQQIENKVLDKLYYGGQNNGDTRELLNMSFELTDPTNNQNTRSNYEYAEEFFQWILSGNTNLSEAIERLNPNAKKFVDSTGLPEGFNSSYGWKIKEQMHTILSELSLNHRSRRAYLNILYPSDDLLLDYDTTMEYPCTIGMHFLIRKEKLHGIVNMRSNNAWSVLPYDVYNFTSLLIHVADQLSIPVGSYYHNANSMHIFDRDNPRIGKWLNPDTL